MTALSTTLRHCFHMVRSCAKIKSFWDNVTQTLSKLIGCTVYCDPALCLLNNEGTLSKQCELTTFKLLLKGIVESLPFLKEKSLKVVNFSHPPREEKTERRQRQTSFKIVFFF